MSGTDSRQALLDKAVAYYSTHGVRDTSLRTLASAIGTSQRMLHYHFGSREDVLAAVLASICDVHITAVATMFDSTEDPFTASTNYWNSVADASQTFGPLFFELASHAMFRMQYAETFRHLLTDGWQDALRRAFLPHLGPETADLHARLTIAVANGTLFQLALTGDRAVADATVTYFTDILEQLRRNPPVERITR